MKTFQFRYTNICNLCTAIGKGKKRNEMKCLSKSHSNRRWTTVESFTRIKMKKNWKFYDLFSHSKLTKTSKQPTNRPIYNQLIILNDEIKLVFFQEIGCYSFFSNDVFEYSLLYVYNKCWWWSIFFFLDSKMFFVAVVIVQTLLSFTWILFIYYFLEAKQPNSLPI